MSKDISKLIEESLQNMEFPYDANAWKAIEKKLDLVKPVQAPKQISKLLLAASVVGVIALCSVGYLWMTNTQAEKVPVLAKKTAGEKEANPNSENSVTLKVDADSKITENEATLKEKVSTDIKENTSTSQVKTQENASVISPVVKIQSTEIIPATNKQLVAPILAKTVYCEGEKIEISNKNDVALELQTAKRLIKTINPNAKTDFNNLKAGNYTLVANGKELVDFKVQENPTADFTIDELLYENGLPFNHVKINSSDAQINLLDNNGKILSTKNEYNAHFFTKGTHTLTVLATNKAGCSTTSSKQVQVESNYNLLAVTGFSPELSDSRRNTFIPYALLERNVDFEMIILDPKTGYTIFTSSDKNNPWNGVDPRTNELVPIGSTFIWKVKLAKAELNEKTNYSGTITRM